jgi:CheY-like chemotaxis protein
MKTPKEMLVLVVDDEEGLRQAIAFEFERKGYQVMTAENGVAARKICETSPVDVVITDVRMPGGDGIELMRSIKSVRPDLPFAAFITGFADITLDEAYHLGADAIFSKPFSRVALRDFVARCALTLDERLNGKLTRDPAIAESETHLEGVDVQAARVTLGRGGMFVALEGPTFRQDTRIRFSFRARAGEFTDLIEGVGVVRWNRPRADESGGSGCGIEFESLSEACRARVVAAIESLRRQPYIPSN